MYKEDLQNLIKFMDYKISKFIEPVSDDNNVYETYIKGEQKACLDVKNILSRLLNTKFQITPMSKDDIIDLIFIFESKKRKCRIKSLNTANGLQNIILEGQTHLYEEVKGILEEFLLEYEESSTHH
ncbi:hypothetical protein [Pelotomaculum propionicicum]|uniref:Uncharacterized protein n=1 Tax=Pelotomaculum propionicicum TaxID=258475 RepID=A0A4Y7RMC6_9FIRM|nr:hypothetical protein [Pelotomaculum propionicicum]NLI11936.1 hypothetical protein [Peptococcaceae bacterium]TEB10148.1 hypothetical protein Pmgp_02553 [Pelotomaculum propionicicum]